MNRNAMNRNLELGDGSNYPIGVGPECPRCGAETWATGCGRWACACGARGGFRDGSLVRDTDDYDRLCGAKAALLNAMCRTDDPDWMEKAADSYARLYALNLNGDKWGIGMHDGCTMSMGWLWPEHVGELEEMLAEAREIVTPNGACPKCDDPECGKVKCQDCGNLMHADDEMVVCGDPVGYSCRACVYGDDDHSISELTDGECDGIESGSGKTRGAAATGSEARANDNR